MNLALSMKKLVIVAACAGALGGCAQDTSRRADTGLVTGAVAGGILGAAVGRGRPGATIVGAVLGGIVGSELGRGMDERDRRIAAEAELDALERGEEGERRVWRSGHSEYYGDIVPGRRYRRGYEDCRDYTHTVYIRGRPELVRRTACRDRDGRWRNVA